VLVSDGQAWSGDVKEALAGARQRGAPMYVVGVGTTGGGFIPEPARPAVTPPTGPPEPPEPLPSVYSTIDRSSLNAIATAGGGDYFELDQESDREIASRIITAARRHAGTRGVEERTDPLYWRFLVVSAGLLFVGILFVRERAELWIHMVGAAIVLLIVSNVFR